MQITTLIWIPIIKNISEEQREAAFVDWMNELSSKECKLMLQCKLTNADLEELDSWKEWVSGLKGAEDKKFVSKCKEYNSLDDLKAKLEAHKNPPPQNNSESTENS